MRSRVIAASPRLAVLAALACTGVLLSVPTLATSAQAAARPARVSTVKLSPRAPDSLVVAWSKARRATRYQVIVSRNVRMTAARVYTTRARSRKLTRLSPAQTHCIQVRGVRGERTFGRRSPVRCTIGQGSTPWIDQQTVVATTAGPRAQVRVRWPALVQATSYQVDFAPSPTGGVVDVQRSTRKRTVTVAAAGSGLQATTIGGLAPGATYCFQVRGRGRTGNGLRSTRRCKVTMSATRMRPSSPTALVVGTFNTCSNACTGWSTRRPLVKSRILQMQLDGRAADVVAVQEGFKATDAMRADLAGTFQEGCRTNGQLQSLFVRSSTYEVIHGTSGSMTFAGFDNDTSHGTCWVRVRNRTTGAEVVVASVHLRNGVTADSTRGKEMQAAMDAVAKASDGAPIVFAGDFNSHRSRALDTPRIELAGIGAEDSYDQAAGYLTPPYLNSACSVAVPCKSWMWGDHVDRIFVTPGIHVAAWKVDYRMSAGRYVTPAPSDHNPVLVSLLVPPA